MRKTLGWFLLVFGLISLVLGWLMREFMLFGLFFLGGGCYVALHGLFLILGGRDKRV